MKTYFLFFNHRKIIIRAKSIEDAKRIGDEWASSECEALTSMYMVEEGSYYNSADWARLVRPLHNSTLKGWEGCAR